MTLPTLSNPAARCLFLRRHALGARPAAASGESLIDLITRIGFVQVDSISTVARAHHMILHARSGSYRPAHLTPLLERDRTLWEHWTHDASILPAAHFPHWRHRFARDRAVLLARWQGWQRAGFESKFDDILTRIADHGPVTSADVGIGEARGTGGWWDWHPSKAALEYLWRTGALSITRRDSFRKVYDLTERVLPPACRTPEPSADDTTDWACSTALAHLGFATPGEIAAYWNAISPETAKHWCARALREGRLTEAAVAGADGTLRRSYLFPETLAEPPHDPGQSLRILSPFDPALRDRKRTERLFGFHYRIEVFVPEAKRLYGYYVFPVLEGDRLIGRIDAKAHRQDSVLRLRAFWPEPGAAPTTTRLARLDGALHRLAAFADCDRVEYLHDWLRTG